MSVLHTGTTHFKSPLRTTIRSLLIARQRAKDKFQVVRERIALLQEQNQRLINKNRALQKQLDQQSKEAQLNQSNGSAVAEFDRCPKRHNFGAKLIALCCELAKTVGFRGTQTVLKHVRDWLDSNFRIPDWTTIRSWLCRIGVAVLSEASQKADDWIWMADHSVQLGEMKVFVILGIRQSQLPKDRPLRRTDMSPLAIVPSIHRNKQEVADQFLQLAEQVGVPLSIVLDGATELHEGAKCFANFEKDVVILDDIKHKAANILKKQIGKSERFKAFESHLGKTTASIQQTPLAMFLPPKKKEKSRFMSLAKLLSWAEMALDHLKHPSSKSCVGIDREKLEAKLSWLREFESDLQTWQACQGIVSRALEFTNSKGIYRGVTAELAAYLDQTTSPDAQAARVCQSLIGVVSECEGRLLSSSHADLKLVASTEVLESLFGGYKRLQGDHTRGTFTSLLASLPSLTRRMSGERVKRYLEAVSNTTLKQWTASSQLGNSTQAQRARAYQETKRRKISEPRQKNQNSLARS